MKPRSEWKQPKRSPLKPRTSRIQRSALRRPKKRKPSEFARIYGSRERVRWVKSLPCLVCASLIRPELLSSQSDNAHTEGDGMGRKGHYTTIIPLCRSHHERYDRRLFPLDAEPVRDRLRNAAGDVQRAWLALSEAA